MSNELVNAWRTIFDTISNDYQRSYELKKANDDLLWKVDNKAKYIADKSAEYDEEYRECEKNNSISTKLERLDSQIEQAGVTKTQMELMQKALEKVMLRQKIDVTPRRTLAEMPQRATETIDNTASVEKKLKSES